MHEFLVNGSWFSRRPLTAHWAWKGPSGLGDTSGRSLMKQYQITLKDILTIRPSARCLWWNTCHYLWVNMFHQPGASLNLQCQTWGRWIRLFQTRSSDLGKTHQVALPQEAKFAGSSVKQCRSRQLALVGWLVAERARFMETWGYF